MLSPDDRVFEIEEKTAAWLAAGTALVWVVNPKSRTITVHRAGAPPRVLSETDTLHGEDVVPDFAMPVADAFI